MVEYNLIMNTVISTHSLKIEGDDAIKFIESLISIDPMVNIFKTSFLLKPDGKVNHWFVIKRVNDKLFIYQSEQELTRIKESLDFYKIRTKCSLEIIKDEKYLGLVLQDDNFNFIENLDQKNIIDWADLSLILELPLPEITLDGLLPNETKWLDFMVDFNKGCFLGQEQASRVKFRGRPRRLLQSNKDSQEFIKI